MSTPLRIGIYARVRDVKHNLGPIVAHAMRTQRAGFLTVPREVFAYVDFLGALYSGYGGTPKRSGRRSIAQTTKAVAFTVEVLGKVDGAYRRCGRLAYEMFRHGTIHVYRPNLLRRRDGATIEFVSYKGARSNFPILYELRPLRVSHLRPHLFKEPARYILPLSINVLYDDLLAAIEAYSSALSRGETRGGTTLLRNFSSTMSVLMEADPTDESW
jgi:hypothetical protein